MMIKQQSRDNRLAEVSKSTGFSSGLRGSGRARLVLLLVAIIAAVVFGGRTTPARHRANVSHDIEQWRNRPSSTRVRVIVPGNRAKLEALLAKHHVPVVRWLNDGVVLSADSADLANLTDDDTVDNLSGDPVVQPTMTLETQSTGAEQTWSGTAAAFPFPKVAGVTGAGIGIAVIDSGISPHVALTGKVVASVSFVPDDPKVTDGYGHGTHVAGIIAGSPVPASGRTPAFAGGIAPGARLINVRVLAANGVGYTSDVIAGIDWAITNRVRYNIRIINLSIGHPVMEPSLTDPLCQAVARAVAQGIVVATSAGNDGMSAAGTPILGGINSPGNAPLALTVGALNTWSTVRREDDTVSEYSSRGPTRFDFTIKPDLAAPGNRILSLEAAGSYLPANYPSVHVAGSGTNAYMSLSGTSMATPMVSGAAALLLEGSPNLGSSQIKLALQAGATYVKDAGLIGAGAGSLNIVASRSIAVNGLSQLSMAVAPGVRPGGVSFWDAGTLAAAGSANDDVRFVSALDAVRVWARPSLLSFGDLNVFGVLNPLRKVAKNRLVWGDAVSAVTGAEQIVWGSSISDVHGNQIIWGTSDEGQIIWGTSDEGQIIWGTTTLTAQDPR